MIADAEMYRKARGVLSGLEGKVRAGEATEAERERAAVIADHLLVWEWAHDGRPAVEVIPPEPAPIRPAMVLRFCDWYARTLPRHATWLAAVLLWWGDRPRESLTGALWIEIRDELEDRDLPLWREDAREAAA